MSTPEIPENMLRARQMYADDVPTRTIMAECKISLHTFYNWIDGRLSKRGEQLLVPLAKRRTVRHLRISPGDRRSLIERMMRSAERQVAEIEMRVGTPRKDREKDARMLATLARAVRELSAIDALNTELEGSSKNANSTFGLTSPHDIEELRRSVARKLQKIIARQRGGMGGEPQSG